MKRYIVYKENGQIVRTGLCPDSMLLQQAQEDEFVMEGQADAMRHYISEGRIIDKLNSLEMPKMTPVDRKSSEKTGAKEKYETELQADALLQALARASVDEMDAWVDQNVKNIAQARELFKKILLVLARL